MHLRRFCWTEQEGYYREEKRRGRVQVLRVWTRQKISSHPKRATVMKKR